MLSVWSGLMFQIQSAFCASTSVTAVARSGTKRTCSFLIAGTPLGEPFQ